ncbi:MAG: amino acid adenylation domain-containing protein [Acidobacteriota bacterium]|nr:amino acid adenylation domain-containing protein [Acidobacteriota bacterium]
MSKGYPLSPQQRFYWERLNSKRRLPESGRAVIRIAGEVNTDRLERALEALPEDHEILKTCFQIPRGMSLPLQTVTNCRFQWRAEDREPDCPSEPEGAAARLLTAPETSPMEAGMLTAGLVSLSAAEHLLILDFPMISLDSKSLELLSASLAARYAGKSEGEAHDEDEDPPLQFIDASESTREFLQSETAEPGLRFWKGVFANGVEAPEFTALAETTEGVFRPTAFEPEPLERALEDALINQAESMQIPVSMIYLTLWTVLLYRLSGQTRICLNIVHDGRVYDDLTEVAGPFSRALPHTLLLNHDEPWTHVLERLKESLDDCATWLECFPASWGSEEHPADPVDLPCFEYRQAGTPHVGESLTFQLLDHNTMSEPFTLKLVLTARAEAPNRVKQLLSYDSRRLNQEQVEEIWANLKTLLHHGITTTGCSIRQLPYFSPRQESVLQQLNSVPGNLPETNSAHTLFERQVSETPNAPALVYREQHWTYRELNTWANYIAVRLRENGLQNGTAVGVLLNRGPASIAAFLGILKSGGVYVPLDSEAGKARFEFMLKDAAVQWVICDTDTHGTAGAGVRYLNLDSLNGGDEVGNPAAEVRGSSAAYIIYTSGSTGTPKGVMVSHDALAAHAVSAAETFGLEAGLRMLVFSVFHFDASLDQILAPLVKGCTLVVRGSEVWTPGEAAQNIVDLELDVVNLPTAYWHVLTRDWAQNPAIFPTRLSCMIAGGEAMLPDVAGNWLDMAPANCRLINAYGPTEAVITAAAVDVESTMLDGSSTPIGRPLPNRRLYVLDQAMQLVAPGRRGELYIGGESLAQGYCNRPALTAAQFVPDPFSDKAGARLYRSGDGALIGADNLLRCLGRNDDQVKIRGFRVEPAEIERLLSTLPGIREAAVAVYNVGKGFHLAAFFSPVGEDGPEVGEVKRFLHDQLPDYMVPETVRSMTELPRTGTRKIDRKALAAAASSSTAEREAGSRALTPTEELLTGIWCDLLETGEVGPGDSFFDLGGHSLLAMRLITRLRALFDLDVSLQQVFAVPVLSDLGLMIDHMRLKGDATPLPPLEKVSGEDLPLSYAQQRLWVAESLNPGGAVFNSFGALCMYGRLEADLLEKAVAAILIRHEVLRTTIEVSANRPRPHIHPFTGWSMQRVDLTDREPHARQEELMNLAMAEAQAPCDLEKGPLFRGILVKMDEDSHVTLFTMHHIVSDGWSVGILSRELAANYAALIKGEEPDLPDLPVQYTDYAVWHRRLLDEGVLERDRAYWRKQLAGAPPLLPMPFGARRGSENQSAGEIPIEIKGEQAAALRELAGAEGATLFMVLLAVFNTLFYALTEATDQVVGTDVANRNHPHLEPVIGFFINQLALRTRLDENNSFRDLLGQVRQTALEAYAHQEMPFDLMVNDLDSARQAHVSPVFQVKFTLQNIPDARLELPGLTIEPLKLKRPRAKMDLQMNLAESSSGLTGMLVYKKPLFDDAVMARFADYFTRLAGLVATEPQVPISSLKAQVTGWEQAGRKAMLSGMKSKSRARFQKSFKAGKR